MKKITKEYKTKTIKELEQEVQKLKEEIAKLRLGSKVNPPKDTNLLVKKRKMLALILTIIAEKKQMEEIKKLKN